MKKFVAELIGTFMLVFVGTGAVVFGKGVEGLGHLGIAFAFGLAIVVAAYSIGTVSDAGLLWSVLLKGAAVSTVSGLGVENTVFWAFFITLSTSSC